MHPTTTTRSLTAGVSELRPSWLEHDMYPFETKVLGTEPNRIAYTDVGDGPVLLFIHTGMWSFVWRDVITRLADTHRCVAFDAPATGLSDGEPKVDATIDAAARAVTRVVGSLDLNPLTLVVHDLGGPASLLASRDWRERVSGLVAVNTFGWRPEGAMFHRMVALMGSAPVRELDAATGFLPRVTATPFGVGRHLDKRERKAFRRGVNRRSFHHYMRDAGRGLDFGEVEGSLDALSDLPLLTVFGEENDPMDFQAGWRKRFANIEQVVVTDGHHFPMNDDPGELRMEIANVDQAAAWDGHEGEMWTEHADRYDRASRRHWRRFLDADLVAADTDVLDIGCGTGKGTRDVARLAAEGSVLGVDLSAVMLGRAREQSDAAGLTNITFEQGDAQVHPFETDAFDVAMSNFGAMFFNDPVAAFTNIGRGVRPGGRLALMAWRELDRNEWLMELRGALAMGRDLGMPPPDAPTPFSLADPDRVRGILGQAGYTKVAFEPIDELIEFGRDVDDAFAFTQVMGIVEGLSHDLDQAARTEAMDNIRKLLAQHETSNGVLLGSSAWLITATTS